MRCPKCGYNSFDHLDSCKKCGKDLAEHKQRYGIVSVLFPGQMKPAGEAAAQDDQSIVDDAVAVATATAAATATTAAAAASSEAASEAEPDVSAEQPVADPSSETDDFGFDFMGDSDEEEDLSFDELFEEASAEDDVEETLPSPEPEAAGDDGVDEFSFDMDAEEEGGDDADLESDFGFDPNDSAADTDDNLDAADFELPPAEDDEFSFDDDTVEFDDEQETGSKEDPKDPFELPESPLEEGAPATETDLLTDASASSASAVEDGELLSTDAQPSSVSEAPVAFDPPTAAQDPEPIAELLAERFSEPEPGVDFFPESAVDLIEEPIAEEPVVATGDVAATRLFTEEPQDLTAVVNERLPATGARVVAFCCDLLLLTILGAVFLVVAEVAVATTGGGLLPSLETLLDLSIPYFLVLFSLTFGYFTLFHFLAGQTPGEMLAGLRVETLTGEPLLFSQAFLRSVGGLLQALPLGLGYLAILASSERRGWNDQLAGTRMISLKRSPGDA